MTAYPISLCQIPLTPTERLATQITFLDWCYGSSPTSHGRTAWGFPAGALTLVHGASGCGKSRLAIMAAAAMTRASHRVLYVQGEVSLPQFRAWVAGQQAHDPNFLVSECDDAETLVALIRKVRPSLLVVDSVSMLAGIERSSRVRQIIPMLKRVIEEVGAHGLLLAHENARGQVKGGSLLPHLVDVVARMYRTGFADWTRFEIGKNRYGASGKSATFSHGPEGLAPIFVSDNCRPMFQVRFDPQTGAERRIVPIPNSGGRLMEVDGEGRPMQAMTRRGWLSRLLG